MEIPEQLKQTISSVTYPVLAYIRKGETANERKTIEYVLTNLSVHVTPEDKFDVKLQDVFKPFTNSTNSYSKLLKYVRSESLSQWEIQRNFAVWCATSGCGIAMTHLLSNIFENDPQFSSMSQELKKRYENKFNLPNEIMSVFRFHVYYQTRRILKQMGYLLPTDTGFSPLSNNVDKTKMSQICDEFGVDSLSLSSLSHRFRYSDENEQKILHIVNVVKDYRLRRSNSKSSFWKAYNMGYDPNKVTDDKFNWEISNDMGWTHFIPKTGKGLTRAGMVRIN